MDYRKMTLEVLFDQLKSAAAADEGGGTKQHLVVARINAINREISSRSGGEQLYREMLSDPNPLVRYAAALSVQWFDSKAAYRVLKELSDGSSMAAAKALSVLFMMEDEGRLPGSKPRSG